MSLGWRRRRRRTRGPAPRTGAGPDQTLGRSGIATHIHSINTCSARFGAEKRLGHETGRLSVGGGGGGGGRGVQRRGQLLGQTRHWARVALTHTHSSTLVGSRNHITFITRGPLF